MRSFLRQTNKSRTGSCGHCLHMVRQRKCPHEDRILNVANLSSLVSGSGLVRLLWPYYQRPTNKSPVVSIPSLASTPARSLETWICPSVLDDNCCQRGCNSSPSKNSSGCNCHHANNSNPLYRSRCTSCCSHDCWCSGTRRSNRAKINVSVRSMRKQWI